MGHDEYWSGRQRGYVEAARGHGMNLAFFSGNEMFWRTRFEASRFDGNGNDQGNESPAHLHRTLVVYKETSKLIAFKMNPYPHPHATNGTRATVTWPPVSR